MSCDCRRPGSGRYNRIDCFAGSAGGIRYRFGGAGSGGNLVVGVVLSAVLLFTGGSSPAAPPSGGTSPRRSAPPAGGDAAPQPAGSRRDDWGQRLLWYVPDRISDLADIFRIRLRLGRGWAGHMRITDYAAFYAGSYDAVFVGLPAAQRDSGPRRPWGREELTGLVFVGGLDATDDTPYGPRYSQDEIALGLQLGLAGAEIGLAPLKIADFAAGLFFIELPDDGFSRTPREDAPPAGALSIGPGAGPFRIERKPARFDDWGARLDYLQGNLPRRVGSPIQSVDEWLAGDIEEPERGNVFMRLRLYSEAVEEDGLSLRIYPEVDISVRLPNVERRLNVFIESVREDHTPDRRLGEQEESRDLAAGIRSIDDRLDISVAGGVRLRWLPVLFSHVHWGPSREVGQWSLRPAQRFFWQHDEGFGQFTRLSLVRWMGERRRYAFQCATAGKWSQSTEGYEWQQELKLARVAALIGDHRRYGGVSCSDLAAGISAGYTLSGADRDVNEHRVKLCWRLPVYKQWVLAEVAPAVDFRADRNYDPVYRLSLGIELLFWDAGSAP